MAHHKGSPIFQPDDFILPLDIGGQTGNHQKQQDGGLFTQFWIWYLSLSSGLIETPFAHSPGMNILESLLN